MTFFNYAISIFYERDHSGLFHIIAEISNKWNLKLINVIEFKIFHMFTNKRLKIRFVHVEVASTASSIVKL